jgi:hypothetical protein
MHHDCLKRILSPHCLLSTHQLLSSGNTPVIQPAVVATQCYAPSTTPSAVPLTRPESFDAAFGNYPNDSIGSFMLLSVSLPKVHLQPPKNKSR